MVNDSASKHWHGKTGLASHQCCASQTPILWCVQHGYLTYKHVKMAVGYCLLWCLVCFETTNWLLRQGEKAPKQLGGSPQHVAFKPKRESVSPMQFPIGPMAPEQSAKITDHAYRTRTVSHTRDASTQARHSQLLTAAVSTLLGPFTAQLLCNRESRSQFSSATSSMTIHHNFCAALVSFNEEMTRPGW